MQLNLARKQNEQSEAGNISDDALNSFTRELGDLCRKHGLGIAGTPTLFVMEKEDYALEYRIDDQSNLAFG